MYIKIKKYNLTVLDKHYNNDFKFLNTIPPEDRKHIEILCDELCFDYCTKMNLHYKELSLTQLGKMDNTLNSFGHCKYEDKKEYFREFENRNNNSKYYVSTNDIQNKYFPLGYKYFKLSGRNKYNLQGFENIASYLIKEQFQLDIRTYLLECILLAYGKDIKDGKS